MNNSTYHKAVLISEVVEYMAPKPGGIYVDATFGGGTHTRAILAAQPDCVVYALDWDTFALDMNCGAVQDEFQGRCYPAWGNFARIAHLLKEKGITRVDGILADFGTSQYQITTQRGFSFSNNTPLDMRMSPSHFTLTAATIVNQASEKELGILFRDYAQEPNAFKIARAIVQQRQVKSIRTTHELADLIKKEVKGFSKIHPATKVFQALRMAVNKELENIESFLPQAFDLLNPEGRLVCISFHSLEDRLVKYFFNDHKDGATVLTKKVVMATEAEVKANNASRCAKLRALHKK